MNNDTRVYKLLYQSTRAFVYFVNQCDNNREYVIHLLLLKKPHVGKIYPDVADNTSQLHFGLWGGVIYANCLIHLQKTVNRFRRKTDI